MDIVKAPAVSIQEGTMRRLVRDRIVHGALHTLVLLAASAPALAADQIHWTIIGQTAVTFNWRGSSSENTIRFGTSPGSHTSTVTAVTPSPVPDSSPGPFWEARLTGLQEDTVYYYVIGSSAEATFRTPPARGSSGFWVASLADIGSSSEYSGVAPTQAQIASDHPQLAGDDRPRLVLAAGDLTYGDQNGASVVDEHFNDVMVWSRWAAYMPAWGNHEDGSSADDRQNYEGRFDFPNSQDSPNAPPAGGPGEEWMWFDYGNVRFISYPEPFSGAWTDWKTKAGAIMAAAQADPAITFIVTFGHRPAYSSGSDHGGDSTLAGHMRDLKLVHSKYVLNLQGHTHHYERSDPAQTGGVLQIVTGGGGSSLGGLSSTQPSWSVYRIDHLQHVKMRVSADRIEGWAICGPPGGGAEDTCAQDAVIDTWTVLAPGGGGGAVNQAPNGTIDVPSSSSVTITAGQSVSFQASGADPDGHLPLAYAWSFGGAAAPSTSQNPGAVTFAAAGTYTVTLTVTDALGASDPTPATRTVTVTAASGVTGDTFYVSPSGSDSAAGTITAPFRTIGFAVGRLGPGDTLMLRGGTYHERPTVNVSGTSSAPVVIQSYPGERAIIDSGGPEFRTPGNSDWELVNASLGEYRSVKTFSSGNIYAYVAGIPGYQNERVGLVPYTSSSAFRSTSDQYVDSSTPFYVGPGTYRDSDSRIHIRLSKTQDMRDMEARYGQVFPTDHADPRQYSIVLSNASTTLTVDGSYLTFKDITIHQALASVSLSGGTHHVTFDGVTIWTGDRGIAVNGSGVNNITVVNSRVYGDVPNWLAWSDAKDAPAPADLMRGTAVNLSSGARDIRISYSHLRGGHDGVGVNNSEDNVTIDHSRIENYHDDCMELEGTTSVGRIAVFENYLGNCQVAIAPGQDTPNFIGPLLVYRNVIVLLKNPYVNRKAGINDWNGGGRFGYEYMFKHGTGSSYTTRNTHYYHNTLVMLNSDGKGINITPKYADNVRIANNLMIMVNGVINGAYRSATGQVWDGDLYWKMNTVDTARLIEDYDTVAAFRSATPFEDNGIGDTAKRGTNPGFLTFNPAVVDRTRSVWELQPTSEVFKPSDFLLAPGSPAVGAGIVIPSHPALGTLPDTRASRDIGAIPFGATAAEYDIFPFVPGGSVIPTDTIPPVVALTAPSAGTAVSGTITLTAAASDNNAVAGVQFRVDGAAVGSEDTTSPYSVSWNTAGVSNGSRTITAVARDTAGNTTVSAGVVVTVSNADTTQPTVSITAPSGGATVGGTVTVTASASDNVGVTGVQFKLDGANLGAEDTASPWSISWNTTGASDGAHTLTAVARDAAGNTRTSSSVSVTVNNADTTLPTVSLTAPAGGATVAGTVTVSASASDNVGVAGVQFRLDGANLGAEDTSSPWSFSWNTTQASNGSHSLTAVARDAAGNTRTSSAVTVTVSNADSTDPTVSLTAPLAGTTVSGTIPVTAAASDNVGVVGVQFKLDGANLMAEDLSAPYGILWNTTTVPNGPHTLTAVARDAGGNVALAASVALTVDNGDTTKPTVSLTAPSAGATVAGTVSLSASALDDVGVVGVQFKMDGQNVGAEDVAAPYAVSWDTTQVANGLHALSAVARDAAGNSAIAANVSVNVSNADRTPPTVSITTPASGISVSGTVTVAATADDDVGVAGVQFKLDGLNLGAEVTAPPFTIQWNTASLSGARVLTAVARDAAGNVTTSAPVNVNVNGNDKTAPSPPGNVRAHGKNKKP
ncbi:MAG TPA: Ig-like domain-containing protein [Candidatus Polarisedimenticolia bacterium]|nr:Ig-like domain-containing protein [Candidatus Polarisedimenticolia bacterium]